MSLLAKGLSFCPTVRTDCFALELDFAQFFRQLKLKVWVSNVETRDGNTCDQVETRTDFAFRDFDLFLGSEFTPPVSSSPTETFTNLIKKDILSL